MARMSRAWLVKSEPNAYSYDDLERDGRTMWDGVRNYQARNFMRDEMQVGDAVLFYHSNVAEPAVVGVARVASEPYPDPTQFDADDPHFDPKASEDAPRWVRGRPRADAAPAGGGAPRSLEGGPGGRGPGAGAPRQPPERDAGDEAHYRHVVRLGGLDPDAP